ncbi:3-epi-6-deoxocathasterone 23-monooxygenase CYP90C1 [Euphorbia lathyris]|uniref:3-epi-6-deoxocathasterone 23-monooxygenase CYP90C1 n=1 Tax=Euphorbia lathyris TaxID=212925 RepID=UPI0033135759
MENFELGLWVFLSIIIGCFSYFYFKNKTKNQIHNHLPKGNLGWPFLGESLDFIASAYTSQPVSFMDKRISLYGKVFKSHILGTPIIVSTDAEVNKVVLRNHGNLFIPAYPKSVRELFGEFSILQMNGILQKKLHSLIAGFLRSPLLKSTITKDIQNSVIYTLASWKNIKPLLIQQETKKITFRVLVKALMGIGPGDDLDFFEREFEVFIKGLICLPIKLPGTTLYKSLKAKERMMKRVRKIVEERKLAMEKNIDNIVANDAIDVLLRDHMEENQKQPLSLDLITGNIIEMMIPGEETVPTAMTLAVKFLSDCSVALNQITEENMELKRKKSDDYKWSDYMSLTFTQNVINETLRLANIINGVWRKALKDVQIKGHLIPEGWCVLASFTSIHMDNQVYENPYQFDPWRWEKGSVNNNNNFTPFGGGQRLCPGLELSKLEISIFLHHLLTTYRWEAEKDEIVYFPTVKMRKKLPITVTTFNT